MPEPQQPVLSSMESISLVGTMAVYDSQADASQNIPRQWHKFLRTHPQFANSQNLYGASPCTGDGKIHYLAGVAQSGLQGSINGESLTLEAGDYAFIEVSDPAQLRDTWVWLLRDWLPASSRRERHAPEFERYTGISEDGSPVGPVEIWIPLEPLAES